jgi:hypothetical protein
MRTNISAVDIYALHARKKITKISTIDIYALHMRTNISAMIICALHRGSKI